MLAYVYVNGESVQETLLKEGLARTAYIFPPNTRYLDEFEEAAKMAKEKSIGVWETDNYVTNRGFNTEVLTNNNAEEKNSQLNNVISKAILIGKAKKFIIYLAGNIMNKLILKNGSALSRTLYKPVLKSLVSKKMQSVGNDDATDCILYYVLAPFILASGTVSSGEISAKVSFCSSKSLVRCAKREAALEAMLATKSSKNV